MVQINVSEWVKKRLDKLKEKEKHKSLDSVIRTLIIKREETEKDGV